MACFSALLRTGFADAHLCRQWRGVHGC